ncbi:hypothetical protein HYALB_00003192 [Hymenoscyphus albidus]|uniref:Uncharacterized protein n=1 Tax=Hymenoscyphus albidus TaxID=595503 RepID=A0A9N9LVQ6_9HELO|nr:hypothetical protein HYALB_00003192 [Hymenoscyphus albidus]
MLFNVLAVATLLTSVSASPILANPPSGYKWEVVDWSAGCSRSGCVYSFNITGQEFGSDPAVPSFSARCVGSSDRFGGSLLTPCGVNDEGKGNRGVLSQLLPVDEAGTGAHLNVAYRVTRLDIPVPEQVFPIAILDEKRLIDVSGSYYSYTANTTAPYNQFSGPTESFKLFPELLLPIA